MHVGGDSTLSSILAVKSRYPESHNSCYQWKPEDSAAVKSFKKRHDEQNNIRDGSRTSATSKKEYFVTLVNS